MKNLVPTILKYKKNCALENISKNVFLVEEFLDFSRLDQNSSIKRCFFLISLKLPNAQFYSDLKKCCTQMFKKTYFYQKIYIKKMLVSFKGI